MSRPLWLFDTSGFVPRWRCGDWSEGLGWVHIVSDLAIWLAYLAIPVVLVIFVRHRRDVPFPRVFGLFGLFILSCGTTHLLEAVIFYEPVYRLAGATKLVTAVVSWATVIALVPVLPRALAMRTPQELERDVAARTAELAAANGALLREIAERERSEDALRASEERFHRTFDGMLEGCQIIGFDWRYLYVNDSVVTHARRTRTELVGRTLTELYPGIETTEAFGVFRRCMEDRTSHRIENRFEYPDGHVAWFDLSVQPSPEGMFVLSVDITDRKRAAEALREKEAQLRATDRRLAELVENMSEACFVVDGEWRFAFVNDRSQSLLHLRREEMIGRAIWDVFGKLVGTPMEGHYRRAMAERVPVSFVAFSPVAQRWLDVRLFPVGDGLAAFLLDIHDRKLAEEALRENESRFRALLENCADSIAVVAADNSILYHSPSVAHVEGYDADELAGRNGLENTHPDDVPLVQGVVRQLLARPGEPVPVRWRRRHKDGRWLWLEGVATNLLDDPAVRGIVTNYRDVTERRSAEEALRASEERFRGAFERTSIATALTDTDNRFVRVNEAFARLLGYTEAELLTMSMVDVIHPDHLAESYAQRGALLSGGATYFAIEKRYRHKDGHELWGLTNISLVRDSAGRPCHYVGQVQDITHRKRAEQEIRRLNVELEQRVAERTSQLEAANKELEAFSYSVSHDLRAPLRAIDGFSRIVLEDFGHQLPADAESYLRDVRANTKQMGRLVDDLLAFSRLGRKPINRQLVATAALVRGCLDELLPAVAPRTVDVRVGDLAACQADPALLKQVWLNLLANALKYTGKRDAAVVEVGSTSGPDGTTYFVKDNGVGFDMRYAHKLFGVFQRLHRAEDYEGTGVGLAIVQRVVHRHGGRVWAEAAPDRGATFFFTLPLDERAILTQEQRSNDSALPDPLPDGGSHRG